MHVRRCLFVLLALGLARPTPTHSAEPPADDIWQVLEPPGEGFRIELPGKTVPQHSHLETPGGKIYVRVYLLTDEKRGRIYQVTANRLPTPTTDLEATLDRTRDGVVKSSSGKLLIETRIHNDRHPGRALTIAVDGERFIHTRLYAADDRLYQVSIMSDAEKLSEDDRRITSSFRISDAQLADPQPQVNWRFVTPKNEKLAVQLPDDPQESNGMLDTPLGRVALTRLECRTAGRIYFVQICDGPAQLVGEDEARFVAAREHALKSTGGKLIAETSLTVEGRPGRVAAISLGDRTLRLRTLLDGPRVYQLGTIGTGEVSADETRFFDSLKLPPREEK